MGFPAKAVALGTGLLFLSACGTGAFSEGPPCTLIDARQGIGLDIKAPDAAKADAAALRICWNGTCRDEQLTLNDTSKSVPQGCTGDRPDDVCGASSSPDGGKYGFADMTDLPKTPVQVTVTLRDAKGERLLRQKIDVTPHVSSPNGKACGAGAPQAGLVVSGGKVTVRR
jgi:hypothetical protein